MSEAFKEIIAIRHGKSETNFTDVYQTGDQALTDPLVEQGTWESFQLAERLRDVPVDVILASNYLRAMQTAKIIQQSVDAPIVVPVVDESGQTHDSNETDKSLFRELDLPSELAGLSFQDPEAQRITDALRAHVLDENWHYSDEENLHDIWQRAASITDFIEQRPEQTIITVSHGGILKAWVAYLMLAEAGLLLRQKLVAYQSFARLTWLDNTGALSLRYKENEGWKWLIGDNQHLDTKYFNFAKDITEEGERPIAEVPFVDE